MTQGQALAPAGVTEEQDTKRLSIVLTGSAYAEVSDLSKRTRRSFTELVRLGLTLVKLWVEETKQGNKLLITTKDGQPVKEIVLPI